MSTYTSIEWTDLTWNPITGCTKISPGCANCYAERFAKRLQAMGVPQYQDGFEVRIHENLVERPLTIKSPKHIFLNSMSDLFHEDVPQYFIKKIFTTMNSAHWHLFQILTKRSDMLFKMNQVLTWSENIWMGVSIENEKFMNRLDDLRKTNASLKFISFEPLLGPIPKINLDGIDWVIVGGESGPRSRAVEKEWITQIRDQCIKTNIPFFFKQWGGKNKKKNGRLLEGIVWDQFPKFDKIKII